MTIERVVTNGQVFLDRDFQPVDIAIAEGKIAAIGSRGAFSGWASETIDARDKLVFPGVIDSHFHSRAPSHPERETFATATAAAAVGGVTTIIEMPISEPPAINGEVVRSRAKLVEAGASIDVGFYASCATLQKADLESSIDAGVLAFKGFLQHVPPGRESEFEGLCLPTNAEVLAAFTLLREFDLPAVFHPEDEAMLRSLRTSLQAKGRRDGRAHAEHRPDYVEAVAVSTLIQLAEHFGVHLHVPHVSSAMTVNLIRDAKARGVRVTAETCPHYLQFDWTALDRLGPYAVCNPPLKGPGDVDALWEAVIDGTIDTIASDHSPFTVEEKDRALEDIWLSPPGFPGVEVLSSFVIGAALQGRITLERLNELIFENPARIFGLWPRKGALRTGADADLMIYDPGITSTFDHTTFHSKAGGIGKIWDGVERTGVVVETLLRGWTVYSDGALVDSALPGMTVRRLHQ